jgi:hypothetical protein
MPPAYPFPRLQVVKGTSTKYIRKKKIVPAVTCSSIRYVVAYTMQSEQTVALEGKKNKIQATGLQIP